MGMPKGGWPSTIAKREAKRKELLAECAAVEAQGDWAMGEDAPSGVATPEVWRAASSAVVSASRVNAIKTKEEPVSLAANSQAPKREREKVVEAENLPHEIPATTFSFALQHVGQNLWRVVMLKHNGDKIIERKFVSHGDLKGNALARLRFMVYQLWFNERMPTDEAEMVPMQPAMHG